MGRTVIGIVVAATVLYVWGFLYWGINPIPYDSLKQTADDEAAQVMLREHFPESGTYVVPGQGNDPDTMNRLHEAGPLASVHITHEGAPVMDPGVMVGGFVLNLVFVALLAVFFHVAKAREFGDFARLATMAGLVAAVLINGGDIVWWRETLGWTLWEFFYNFTAFLVAGHMLGIFMKEKTETGT